MSVRLTIYVGTMTGTAELVAQEIEDWLAENDGDAEIVLMDDLDHTAFEEEGPILICTSTYGQGDVPDNAQALFDALSKVRPSLGHVQFGLIGLGDSTYQQTFCFGGKRFDKLLGELGATRIGEAFYHDASSGDLPEEDALEWFKSWVPQITEERRQAA
ncbi:MAG: flavodoxin domain-containing protein [Pseudomonadota bacterium]